VVDIGGPVSVVIIEDDESFAELSAALLRRAGNVTVRSAANLADGVRAILDDVPDCVILDLHLPDGHGAAAVRSITGLPSAPPVVVLTSSSDSVLAREALASGAQDFLEKGAIDGRSLHRAISYAIERHRLEKQLREAATLEGVGRVASGLAHDLNNILMVINGHAALARDLVNDDLQDVGGHLIAIGKATDQAAVFTRRLLAYARNEVERRSLTSVGSALRDLAGVLAPALKNLAVTVEVGPDGDAVAVDPQSLAQIGSNLLLNAAEAGAGSVRVTVGVVNDAGSIGDVVVRFSDDGHGIEPADVARLFEPYFTTKPNGSGLGLTSVRSAVERVGGSVEVSSTPGKGTIFTIHLPRVTGAVAASPPSERESHVGARVLVVDDEPFICDFVATLLRSRGYTVEVATSPLRALETISMSRPEVLVTDVVMPEMSGPELAAAIIDADPSVRVVFMSGFAGDALDDSELGDSAEFLPKPFSSQELLSLVEKMVSRRRAELRQSSP
jgi:two-component system, cell cycle sensor histidine kinase and response regulator CckA